eukprot:1689506-Rhodomonas_salina.2
MTSQAGKTSTTGSERRALRQTGVVATSQNTEEDAGRLARRNDTRAPAWSTRARRHTLTCAFRFTLGYDRLTQAKSERKGRRGWRERAGGTWERDDEEEKRDGNGTHKKEKEPKREKKREQTAGTRERKTVENHMERGLLPVGVGLGVEEGECAVDEAPKPTLAHCANTSAHTKKRNAHVSKIVVETMMMRTDEEDEEDEGGCC